MKPKLIVCVVGIWLGSLFWACPASLAAEEGFLPVMPEAAAANMLPAGAVQEGAVVRHKISSTKENLHLLAAYYYGNPRLWQKIYADNRSVIKNPNKLPVGQTIRIQVGDGWKPKFSYQEWFNLALRNGEWVSGQAWSKAPVAPTPAAAGKEVPAAEPQAAPTPAKTPQTVTPTPEKAVSAPKEAPAKTTPTPAPTAETPPAQAAPAKATPTPAKGKPAEPAF